ncbi:hypothetical protein ILUMI_25916, partial [Ignelater luminosus]
WIVYKKLLTDQPVNPQPFLDSENSGCLTYESVLLSGSNRSNSLSSPHPPEYAHKTTSYTQIDAMLDRMLFEVERQEELFALDLDLLDQNEDHYVNTLELVPCTDALLEIPIKKTVKVPKTYETKHEMHVDDVISKLPEDLIDFGDELQITDLDEDDQDKQDNKTANLDQLQETVTKLLLEVETDEAGILLDKIAENDCTEEEFPYELINFQRNSRASSESTSDVTIDNYPSSWEDQSDDHDYEPIEPSTSFPKPLHGSFDQISDIWWEGTYRNLSVVPEEDEENVSLIGNQSSRSFTKTEKKIACDSPCNSSSTGSTDEEDIQKHQRTVKAEVKLLVKTTDRGKEEIEIRSVREFLNDNSKTNMDSRKSNTLPATFSKNNNSSHLYKLKENKTDKPVFTLQRLFIRPNDTEMLPIGGSMINLSNSRDIYSSRTELLATSPKQYPLQYDSSMVSSYEELLNESDGEENHTPKQIIVGEEKVDLYANRPFYPCYNTARETFRSHNVNPFTEFTSNPFHDPSQIPEAYCDWLSQTEDQDGGNVNLPVLKQLIRMEFFFLFV